jgi:hypothetical protein
MRDVQGKVVVDLREMSSLLYERNVMSIETIWAELMALISSMAQNGSTVAAIKLAISTFVSASALPPLLKPMIIGLANSAIDAIVSAANAPPPAISPK